MLALCHISHTAVATLQGRPWPPHCSRERQAVPAALDELPVGLLVAVGRAHDAVLEPRALPIARWH